MTVTAAGSGAPARAAGEARIRATVLIVCTGNICRSPAAERLLAARLPGDDVTVVSAGIRARVGEPVDARMAELLRAADVGAEGFAALELQPEQLRQADLVLTMAREHRAAAVAMTPTVVRRTILLAEAAAIAESVAAAGWPEEVDRGPAARLAALPGLAPRYRTPPTSVVGEIPDPYRHGPEVYRTSFSLIEAAVDRLARAVV